MRVEVHSPRTWALAILAGAALLAWLLALAGMGGQADPLPDDPGLRQALPQPRPSPQDRLGPVGQYAGVAQRPLFADDRRPHPFSLQPGNAGGEADGTFDYVLTGVLVSPQLRMAIIQPGQGGKPLRIRLGAAAEGLPDWRLVDLDAHSARFEGPQGSRTLVLRSFDGNGGTAPRAEPAAATPATQVRDTDNAAGGRAGPDAAGNDDPARTDAIRRRIEARRVQLRQEAAQDEKP